MLVCLKVAPHNSSLSFHLDLKLDGATVDTTLTCVLQHPKPHTKKAKNILSVTANKEWDDTVCRAQNGQNL